MNHKIEIIYTPNPSSEEIQSLYNGIQKHAKLKKNQPPIECFGFFVYSDLKEIIGGCSGAMYYGCLTIDSLWVDESLRNKKVGTRLIESAETLGKNCGCSWLL